MGINGLKDNIPMTTIEIQIKEIIKLLKSCYTLFKEVEMKLKIMEMKLKKGEINKLGIQALLSKMKG